MALRFDHVRTKNLGKVFGTTRALRRVSVRFAAGEVTVVEGPNGSGKSTLMSIVATLARPTSGTVFYGKHTAEKAGRRLRGSIGILAHAAMLYPDLNGRENLSLFASLYGIEKADERIAELEERFEIGGFVQRPTRTYSRGQLQRVALARAVLHRPKLLLLDEPSTGLDVKAVERLERAIADEREAGTILVLITHDAALADRIGDRRIRLDRGQVVAGEGGSA